MTHKSFNNNESKSTFPLVSVVIVNINSFKYVLSCIKSLLLSDYDNIEVIVVDYGTKNLSRIVTTEISDVCHNKVKIVHLDVDYGLCFFRNLGVQKVGKSSRYLLFLDNDVIVTPHFIKELVETMESDERIGACQGKVVFLDAPHRIQSTGLFIDIAGNAYLRGFEKVDKGQFDYSSEVFYTSGCAMMTRREVFDLVGGFDDLLFFWSDDLDFCWRVRLAGNKVVYVPSAVVYHKGGATRSVVQSQAFTTYHVEKSRLITLIKNHPLKRLLFALLFYYIFYLPKLFVFYMLTNETETAVALLRSNMRIISGFKRIWRKRLEVMRYLKPHAHLEVDNFFMNINIKKEVLNALKRLPIYLRRRHHLLN